MCSYMDHITYNCKTIVLYAVLFVEDVFGGTKV